MKHRRTRSGEWRSARWPALPAAVLLQVLAGVCGRDPAARDAGAVESETSFVRDVVASTLGIVGILLLVSDWG